MAKLDNPSESGKVRSALSGATRKAGLLQKQARGLTESDLDAIKKSACRPRRSRGGYPESEETARRRGEVDIAIVSLMRDCLMRVSEAAAARRCDIEQMEDGTGRLLIRRSKTDQEGKSAKAFISRTTMEAIRCIGNGASQEESVFGLRRNQISKRIKQAAKHAGPGDGFSGHSFCNPRRPCSPDNEGELQSSCVVCRVSCVVCRIIFCGLVKCHDSL